MVLVDNNLAMVDLLVSREDRRSVPIALQPVEDLTKNLPSRTVNHLSTFNKMKKLSLVPPCSNYEIRVF